ncbi:MAG: hypothetical protein GY853_13645 [PVC group bacterium]|nr:hypothetical protein [PVC group bacterium]
MRKYYICPDGQNQEITECIKEGGCRMPERCLNRHTLTALGVQREKDLNNLVTTTTELLPGTRQAYLKLTKEYAEDPTMLVFLLLGLAMHSNLEKRGGTDQTIVEERLTEDGISGQFDIYEVENDVATLADYKSSGSYMVSKALGVVKEKVIDPTGAVYKTSRKDPNNPDKYLYQKGDPKMVDKFAIDPNKADKLEWTLQLNDYRIKVEKTGLPVHKLQIIAIVRDGGTYLAKNRGLEKNSYIIPIPILPDETVKTYFQTKRTALLHAVQTGEMPPVCSMSERWDDRRCEKFCPVNIHCDHHAKLTEREK